MKFRHIASEYGGPLGPEGLKVAHERCLDQCVGYFGTNEIVIEAVSTTVENLSGVVTGMWVTMIAYKEFDGPEEFKKWKDWWHGTKTG